MVIPAELRKRFGINAGERLLAIAARRTGSWVLLLTQFEAVSMMVSQMVYSTFSENADIIPESGEKATFLSRALQRPATSE